MLMTLLPKESEELPRRRSGKVGPFVAGVLSFLYASSGIIFG